MRGTPMDMVEWEEKTKTGMKAGELQDLSRIILESQKSWSGIVSNGSFLSPTSWCVENIRSGSLVGLHRLILTPDAFNSVPRLLDRHYGRYVARLVRHLRQL